MQEHQVLSQETQTKNRNLQQEKNAKVIKKMTTLTHSYTRQKKQTSHYQPQLKTQKAKNPQSRPLKIQQINTL